MFSVPKDTKRAPAEPVWTPGKKVKMTQEMREHTMLMDVFTTNLMWNLRFGSILCKMTEEQMLFEAKKTFVLITGRQPHYGSELFEYVNISRQCFRVVDEWVPDAFQIWQEEQFDQEVGAILAEIRDAVKEPREVTPEREDIWKKPAVVQKKVNKKTVKFGVPPLFPEISEPMGVGFLDEALENDGVEADACFSCSGQTALTPGTHPN